ncbi:MAG: SMC family ATPase [Chloroflexota bacterium]|nr:MAG: SMC family ATPase [Chloroflexota bacterium]
MIIEAIRLKNFLSHEDSAVEFTESPLWLVCGENGSGKSALFDGVEYALYGRHRGGDQGVNLLVKHGSQRAMAQVVVQLGQERYRVTCHLDARKGNLGGQVESWDQHVGTWRPINVGDGVAAAWTWLKPRLPDVDLFHSAIFLRQGQTAFFLRGSRSEYGTATDRIKRFASLLDLSRYTELSQRAQKCAGRASDRQKEAQGGLSALGDVSDEALDALECRLESASTEVEMAQQQVEHAAAISRGAERWNGLEANRQALLAQRKRFVQLIGDAAAIRRDADLVAQWDRAAAMLDRHWRCRKEAGRTRVEAQEALAQADTNEKARRLQQAALSKAEIHYRVLNEKALPALRRSVEATRNQAIALSLEAEIAETRCGLVGTTREVELLDGKDTELAEWRKRENALVRLELLATYRQDFERANAAAASAKACISVAERRRAIVGPVVEQRNESARQAHMDRVVLGKQVEQLNEQVAQLKGRIQSHGRLSGGEGECPVCGQELDEDRHAHVKAMLATETTTLQSLQWKLQETKRQHEDSKAAEERTAKHLRSGQRTQEHAQRRVVSARQGLRELEANVDQVTRKSDNLRSEIIKHHSEYEGELDLVTLRWVADERDRVADGLHNVESEADALNRARQRVREMNATLKTLRGRRTADAPPLGETEEPKDLQERAAAAQKWAEKWSPRIELLDQKSRCAQEAIRVLLTEVTALAEKIQTGRASADSRKREAVTADGEADDIAAKLGSAWATALASREAYETERQSVESRRESAERLSELERASGQLTQVEAQLTEKLQAMDAIDLKCRIPVEDAHACEKEAREAELSQNDIKRRLEEDLNGLTDRRAKSATYERQINDASEESETYSELADLLKEGGPIQVQVAEQAQQQIAQEVNEVLSLLGDPLRIRLGAARRGRGVHLQDIHIVDTSDPVAQPRFFEFLSGGEQFRVALALALALHKRVAHGQAGTIIIDEGFGALDEHKRDALALQLTDTSRGILSLGLASSVIISSHSTVVQRHFPYRWFVQKQGGTATVLSPGSGSDGYVSSGVDGDHDQGILSA